jgi:tRNA threonylcarbamoyl adenosine modification protein (Sua5/YciO/YrdC/YwlC family)
LVETVVSVLNKGGLVVVPTDTSYGVLANASNLDSVEKLRKLREMSDDSYFPFLVTDKSKILSLFSLDDVTTQLVEEYLPGSLTIVAEGAGKFEGRYIGVRFPEHNFLTAVSEAFDGDLILTAASKFNMSPIYDIEQLSQQYADCVDFDLIIDAETLELVPLSNVVKSSDNQIEILREGDLTALLVSQFSHKQV